jgi:hypothetical protein
MKKLFFVVLIGFIIFAGCISGEIKEKVNADASVHRIVYLEKTGILVTANCKSLEDLAKKQEGVDSTALSKIKNFCRDTDDQLIVEYDLLSGDEENPVSVVEKGDEKYLRYEDNTSPLDLTISMPSKITNHNGKLKDDYTVFFKGSTLADSMGGGGEGTIFVESKVPETDYAPLLIGLALVLVIFLVALIVFSNKKQRGGKK